MPRSSPASTSRRCAIWRRSTRSARAACAWSRSKGRTAWLLPVTPPCSTACPCARRPRAPSLPAVRTRRLSSQAIAANAPHASAAAPVRCKILRTRSAWRTSSATPCSPSKRGMGNSPCSATPPNASAACAASPNAPRCSTARCGRCPAPPPIGACALLAARTSPTQAVPCAVSA